MEATEIAEYLKKNPSFFEDYPEFSKMLWEKEKPNAQVISLVERQNLILRKRQDVLEKQLQELMLRAKENDAISGKVQRVAIALLRTATAEATLQTFLFHITENFNVPYTALRLWGPQFPLAPLAEAEPVSEDLRRFAAHLKGPLFTHRVEDEVADWLTDASASCRSYLQIPLAQEETIGLWVMGSPDPHRFHPSQGILFLDCLTELLTATLQRNLS